MSSTVLYIRCAALLMWRSCTPMQELHMHAAAKRPLHAEQQCSTVAAACGVACLRGGPVRFLQCSVCLRLFRTRFGRQSGCSRLLSSAPAAWQSHAFVLIAFCDALHGSQQQCNIHLPWSVLPRRTHNRPMQNGQERYKPTPDQGTCPTYRTTLRRHQVLTRSQDNALRT